MRHERDAQLLVHQLQQAVYVGDLQGHRAPHPGRRERRVGRAARTEVRVEVDEGLTRQLRPGRPVRRRQPVPRRAQQHHGLPGQRDQLAAPARRVHRRGERDVEPPARHPVDQPCRALLAQPDLHVRVGVVEGGEQPGQPQPGHALLHAHRQGPAQQPPYRVDGLLRGPHPGQGAFRLDQQGATRLGQPYAAGGPAEQRRPQLLLQRPYGGGEPGLRDGDPLRRAGEMPLLGDGHEMFQLTQLHD